MSPRRLVAAACASVVLLGACGAGSDSDDGAAPAVSSAPAGQATTSGTAAPADPTSVPEALQFTAPTVGGGELDAATLAGTPTLFWFWAPT